MKKIFLLLSCLLVVGWITSIAQREPVVDPNVKESFKKEFPEAQFAKWSSTQDYDRVDFVIKDYRLGAFFNKQGDLLETHRDLNYNQLPLAVMKELEKNFPETTFSKIEEISSSSGTKYSLTAENPRKIFKIAATPDGTTSVVERQRKIK
jgi:hypothetical protein